MIHYLTLKNFKCFENERIPIAPLTVLSGVNGMGKSTVLQSFLLLRQSVKASLEQRGELLLNGPLVQLGTSDDIYYENAKKSSPISLEFIYEDKIENLSFIYEKNKRTLKLQENSSFERTFSYFGTSHFFYLRAERVGPRVSFPIPHGEVSPFNTLGNAGEFCASFLFRLEREKIACEDMLHPQEPRSELRLQTEAWLSEIGQKVRLHVNEYSRMDSSSLEFSFLKEGLPSMKYRPTNVGFGLTYSLPIFLACLMAHPGEMILVENPEAHLHPKGQVLMGKFLSLAASCGIQVILETHSDHVLNGIRMSVKQKKIPPENVALHFFHKRENDYSTTRTTVPMDQEGRLYEWPEGFFDEWEKGLMELL